MLWQNAFFSCALAMNVFAFTKIPPSSCESRDVCDEHCGELPFAFSYPLDLGLNCPRDFYVHVDGLLFSAKQGGMDFAIEDTSGNGQTPAAPITYGKVFGFSSASSSWEYNPGFRLGFGFNLGLDKWDLGAEWTHVNITDYAHATASAAGGLLIPLWVLGSGTPNGGMIYDTDGDCNLYVVANLFGPNASAVWKAHYDVLDLDLGKASYVSQYLIIKPHFGVRFGSIDQHFSVDYGGGYHSADTTETCDTCSSELCPPMGSGRTIHHGDNRFRGLGIKVGIGSQWILGKEWALFQDLSASVLSGKFRVYQNMILPTGISCPGFSNCANGNSCPQFADIVSLTDGFDLTHEFYRNIPNLELSLGISWDRYFDRHKYRLGVRAAYEFIMWWNMLQMRKFFSATSSSTIHSDIPCELTTRSEGSANDTVSRGNLSMNGFSLRIQLDM